MTGVESIACPRARWQVLWVFAAAAAACAVSAPLHAADPAGKAPTIFDLSIEELVSLEVTSVSKKAERLEDATSAVYVISRDDIRRNGARSLPEALRLAPGLAVLQIDANKWAVGSRGLVGRFANKLLVMIDGRIVYTPSFSGVFWDVQDTNLDDVERIEVIRGPGATIWGSNAVSGVINVITRVASADPGASITTRVQVDGAYGVVGRIADRTANGTDYRVFLKHDATPAGDAPDGTELNDDWHLTRIGTRVDRAFGEFDRLSITSEAYSGAAGLTRTIQTFTPPYPVRVEADVADVSGAFATARWTHQYDGDQVSELQFALDETRRDAAQYREDRHTIALDAQHQHVGDRLSMVWGGSFRYNRYTLRGSETVQIFERNPSDTVISAFVQGEWQVVPERLKLIVGSKFENNSLSTRDIEFMPSARALWQASPTTNVWGAATRAMRTPAHADRVARVFDVIAALPPGTPGNPFPVPQRFAALGARGFESEEVTSYEAGVRSRIGENLAWSVSLYDMQYSKLRVPTPGPVTCQPTDVRIDLDPTCLGSASSVVVDLLMLNGSGLNVRGGEFTLDLALTPTLRMRGAWAVAHSYGDSGVLGPDLTGPQQQVTLQCDWKLAPQVAFSTFLRYVDAISTQRSVAARPIEAYGQADVQVTWTPSPRWQIAVSGRNLVSHDGPEFFSELNDVLPADVETTAFIQAHWSF